MPYLGMVDQKLLDAIKQYLDQGVSKESIKNGLINSGWPEKEINKAFEKITGQKIIEEKKVVEEKKKVEEKKVKVPVDKRKIFVIAGGIAIVLILAVLAYFFLFKVGFSDDIPDDLVPGKLHHHVKSRIEGYNSLALTASIPLKDAIQNGRVHLIMTNNRGTKIIDAIGITVENSQIVSTAVKVDNPSFDVKFTESMFDSVTASSSPSDVFLDGYSKGNVKVKAYGKENELKLDKLNNFVQHFFVL